jgi:spermidine synthase
VTELARSASERGELVLRRRDDQALELRVNGVFVMDAAAATSERQLAVAGMAAVASPRRVLVAGLGLGVTLRAVLDDPRVEQVTVVELEPALVDWLRSGLVPGGAATLADPRVSVLVADVADAVAVAGTGAYDLALLDVDNGPDFLVHDANADLYRVPFLRACRRMLDVRGALVVWSMSQSRVLADRLGAVFGQVQTQPCPVRLGARDETYWLHVATPAARPHRGH